MDKVYINLTNKCNLECKFCCMYSRKDNGIFMSFPTFVECIKPAELQGSDYIVQFEGGEPLLHTRLYLFIEYLATLPRCKKIKIDTNGKLLKYNIDKIVEHGERLKIPIELCVSINSEILNHNNEHIELMTSLFKSIKYLENISMRFNVRYSTEDELSMIMFKISSDSNDIITPDECNIYQLNRYGRASEIESLPEIKIKEVYNLWWLYACDGTPFGRDLVRRSEYEKSIGHENS